MELILLFPRNFHHIRMSSILRSLRVYFHLYLERWKPRRIYLLNEAYY